MCATAARLLLELGCDPLLDVLAPIADVPPDTESTRSLASVAPRIDCGEGHIEEPGEILC